MMGGFAVTTITAVLLSAFIALLILENYGYGYWMFSRPVVGGAILGLIMGNLPVGLLVGGSVELMFMGVLPIGGSVPPNAQIAGLIGTAFAILSGGKSEVGIVLAMPVGILAQFLIMLAWNVNIGLVHRADKYIQENNTKKVEQIHLMGLVVFYVIFFVATFVALRFGSTWVSKLVADLPGWLSNGLKASSTILPAVGMAMLIKMMDAKKYWSFLLLGFVMAEYLNLNVLAISLMGLAIAAGIFSFGKPEEPEKISSENELENNEVQSVLNQKDLKKVFFRSFFSMTSINYERYCNLGFCYAMIPALKKFYKNPEEYKEALARHNEFFNCHPYTGNAVLGVTLALEEKRAVTHQISPEVISSTKAALMGPLSGIGDSVFKATFMTIFAAIGAGMCLEGNAFGPIIFIVPNVLLNLFSRWYFIKFGYKFGISLVNKIHQSNLIDKFVMGATIVGLMVTAAMIVNFVKIPIAAAATFGGKKIVVQDMLNQILPGLIPVVVTLVYYKILEKSKNGNYICIILSFVFGILGKVFYIL
jgi:mannose/fructose/N-acetylgalactosamine-specific phosphotransferase system component IID/mannose/fructose/N-acetylgalactosamine-specific phosphotransferase system component IIC